MSRPIPAEGTFKYSIGKPGRESAFAVAKPPAATRPHITTATSAETTRRRNHINFMELTHMHAITMHSHAAAQWFCENPREMCACISAEVAAAGADGQLELSHPLGHDGDGAGGVLHLAADQQRRRRLRQPAVPRPNPLRTQDVDHPGFVLEVEERHALRSR